MLTELTLFTKFTTNHLHGRRPILMQQSICNTMFITSSELMDLILMFYFSRLQHQVILTTYLMISKNSAMMLIGRMLPLLFTVTASLYGTAILCGIGFTMSLFIGSLAFEESGVNLLFDERLGIIIGSLISGLFGYFILRSSLADKTTDIAK